MSDKHKNSKQLGTVAQPAIAGVSIDGAGPASPAKRVSEALEVSTHTLSAAVDVLAYPMMALQADGLLLHANKAALDVLHVGQVFLLSASGHVAPKTAVRRAEFAAAMQATATGQTQQLSWPDGQTTLYASLRLLQAPTDNLAAAQLLLMMAPPADALFDASGFAASYNLSPAETRVLEALMHGNHAEATAKRLGVGVATVRSQIASIREKTGHDSVASLLAMLGDLPPLRGMDKAAGKPKKKAARTANASSPKPDAGE